MKKILFPTALVLVAAGSWAFRAKTAEPASYMMLTSHFVGSGFSAAKGSLVVIMPDGQVQTQDVEVKSGTPTNVSNSLEQLHLKETIKLNELRAAGWRVKTATQMNGTTVFEMTYLLEKE